MRKDKYQRMLKNERDSMTESKINFRTNAIVLREELDKMIVAKDQFYASAVLIIDMLFAIKFVKEIYE